MIDQPLQRRRAIVALAGFSVLVVVPAIAGPFYVDLTLRLILLALLALGLDLAVGVTGLLSLGHAAFFGIAGYALAWLTPESGPANLWLALPAAIALAAAMAAIFGWIALRTSGAAFLMITLALGQVLYYALLEIRTFGGADGLLIGAAPAAPLIGVGTLSLAHTETLYYVALGALAITYVALGQLVQSPFGRALQALRDNETRARAIGLNTGALKLMAFTLSGGIAGAAGFLAAAHDGFISPEYLAWHASGQALITVVLGGVGTLLGPVLGTFAYGFLQDTLQNLTPHWRLALGLLVIGAAVTLPRGLISLLEPRKSKGKSDRSNFK